MMLVYASVIVHPHNTRLQHATFEHMDMGVPMLYAAGTFMYTHRRRLCYSFAAA